MVEAQAQPTAPAEEIPFPTFLHIVLWAFVAANLILGLCYFLNGANVIAMVAAIALAAGSGTLHEQKRRIASSLCAGFGIIVGVAGLFIFLDFDTWVVNGKVKGHAAFARPFVDSIGKPGTVFEINRDVNVFVYGRTVICHVETTFNLSDDYAELQQLLDSYGGNIRLLDNNLAEAALKVTRDTAERVLGKYYVAELEDFKKIELAPKNHILSEHADGLIWGDQLTITEIKAMPPGKSAP